MKSRLQLALEILFGILIIAFILSKIDFSEAVTLLLKLDVYPLLLAVLVYVLTFIITAYGLKVLFDSITRIRFVKWMKYYLITFSLGLVLPGRTGEFSIIYFLKKNQIEVGSTTALVIIDKLITLIVFGFVTLLGLFTIIESKELYLGLLAIFLILLFSIILFSDLGKRIISKILGKYSSNFSSFHESYRNLILFHKDKLLINFIVTILRPILNGLLIIILFRALGYDVPLFYATIISSITLIASLVPLTPNGLGIREGLGLFLFSKLGIPFEASLSMYLLIFIMNYLTGALGVIYYLSKRKHDQ